MKPSSIVLAITLLAGLAGCREPIAGTTAVAAQAMPTPTFHSLFSEPTAIDIPRRPLDTPVAGLPTLSGAFQMVEAEAISQSTPYPSATWMPTAASQARANAQLIDVYSDDLQNGWEVVSPSNQMNFNLRSTAQIHGGSYSIAVSPQQSHAKIYIVSGAQNKAVYPREQVYGVSLYLYSGERGLDLYDLALTMIGSNVYTYWRAEDNSVESKTPYEETFLRYLNFNGNIPPNTWSEVTIWLDEMRFDPDYKYVTGLYLTNRKGFTRTFSIDDVVLILKPGAETSATATPMPTPKANMGISPK